MKTNSVAVIVPIYNAATTLYQTLNSLLNQTKLPDKLILVNDASTDNSEQIIDKFLEENKAKFKASKTKTNVIKHKKSQGLAASYNDGIRKVDTKLVVTLHSDILLEKLALEKLIEPFTNQSEEDIVASYHLVKHPYVIWEEYNFWQKCFFSRLVEREIYGLDGKFDCFKREVLVNCGYFDEKRYRNAGEDGDIIYKLKQRGTLAKTDAEIIHIHSMDPKFSYKNIISKQKQYSEAQGILLRLGMLTDIQNIPMVFFRELLVFGLLIPFINVFSLLLICTYAFYYTKLVYIKEYRNPRIYILPFLNIYLLFVSTFYALKGFINGKQK